MIIDFHTHIFPDAIAPATIAHLSKVGGMKPSTNGTADGLRQSMRQAGIDLSVVLPVVTKPSQFDSIQRFAVAINREENGLLSFGGIHPDCDDVEDKLDTIVSLGLKGIKLHPDYQGVFIDDERYIRIMQGAIRRGLLISIHAGVDIGLPSPVHCPPDRMRAALDRLTTDPSSPRIILAHTGGFDQWDDVERYLVGQAVYLDISFTLPYIQNEQLVRIMRTHGCDRLLFATDSPWGDQTDTLHRFLALPLTEQEQQAILSGNARRLLFPENIL